MQGEGAMLTSRSGWQIEGDSVYRFGAIRADNVVLDLTRYRFDDRQLVEATHAQRARWEGDAWQLENIATTRIFDNHTESDQTASMGWDTAFTPTNWRDYCAISRARRPASYGPTPNS